MSEPSRSWNGPFIGESGLDALFPGDPASSLAVAPRASVGINQAIWAAAVSGAMNGRALWFEDGYDQDHDLCAYAQFNAYPECTDGDPATILLLRTVYANASAPVASFLAGVDYSGFASINAVLGNDLVGAARWATRPSSWDGCAMSSRRTMPMPSIPTGLPGCSAARP